MGARDIFSRNLQMKKFDFELFKKVRVSVKADANILLGFFVGLRNCK